MVITFDIHLQFPPRLTKVLLQLLLLLLHGIATSKQPTAPSNLGEARHAQGTRASG